MSHHCFSSSSLVCCYSIATLSSSCARSLLRCRQTSHLLLSAKLNKILNSTKQNSQKFFAKFSNHLLFLRYSPIIDSHFFFPPLRLQSRPSPADFCSDPCPEPSKDSSSPFIFASRPPANKADRSVFDGRCKSLFRHMLLPVNRCQPDYIRLDYSSSSFST